MSGRNSENLIEYVGLFVVHGREVLAKRKAEGLKVILAPTADRQDHGFVDTSDNSRLSDGVKFEEPYSKSRDKSFASAVVTDPWGASIELTEGLKWL